MHETRELEYITSVSETIRKPPLAEAQTALGKQKNTFCGTRVSVPLSNFYESLLPTQNFTEIGQSAAEVWQKQCLKWRPSAIVNLTNFHWSYGCHRVPNLLLCTEFHRNRMIFC